MSNEFLNKTQAHFELKRTLQDGEYISDIITPETMAEWHIGNKVLITSNTGTGKTYFVMDALYKMCSPKKYKILLLTNRVWLREQLIALYGEKSKDLVTIMNYQSYANYIVFHPNKIEDRYKIIVADEAHWFFADSPFSNKTDIPLNYLINNTDNQLVIFISATSKILQSYFAQQKEHCLDFNYQFIRPYRFDGYYYWDDIQIIRKMLLSLPKDEKAIYFCSNLKTAYQLHMDMPNNSAFICATKNQKYGQYCSVETLEQLRKYEKFDTQILFTTSVIENGINIKDSQVKHIIIDLNDFDTIVQCIGRRRIMDKNDLPSIYIKQFRQASLQTQINNIERKLRPLNYFRTHNNIEFNAVYGKKSTYGLLYTEGISKDENISRYEVNYAKEMKFKYDIDLYRQINKKDGKFGHLKHLCDCMNIPFTNFQDLAMYYDKVTITDKLNYYIGKKLFDADKTQFVEFLKKDALKPMQGGYKAKTVNSYFNDRKIPFVVIESKEKSRKSNKYNKRFWMVKHIEEVRPQSAISNKT